MSVIVDAKLKRGPESWAYFSTALGFVVTIESTVIGMMTPLSFPWNIVVFAAIAAVTIWQFIENEWFHKKLIGFKDRYENKLR
jgi:hypothetical protein